jgi:predicted esterase
MRVQNITLVALLAVACTAEAGLLSKPDKYTPEKSWPVVVATQSNPDPEVMRKTPYFLVHAGGKGTECTTKIRSELTRIAARYNIDPLRIYATSFSRGGHEIILQTLYHPHWFAAIAPVCNDLRNGRALEQVKYIRTPTLFLHGDHDSFRNSGKRLYENMKEGGVPIDYQLFPGGHSPTGVWNTEKNVLWLDFFAAHQLNPYPKEVVHVVEHKRYSRAYWVNAALVEDKGNAGGFFTVTVLGDNVIKVDANEKIASLDLYLTDALVDMKKPVKILQGDKKLFEGQPTEKITVKFHDVERLYQSRNKPLWEEIEAARQGSEWMKKLKADGKTSTPVEVKPTGKGVLADPKTE